ncbi:MAG TPA: PASTA domain-containing protein [Solirubrobacteraceae bacterium]|nr:PASTA domain-containing protein [Solirubrobacteraceae bacterium]
MVGDYVGQPASDAAQAVRRAGLRPGLDRSFGCAPELVGQIVAQEPPAGSDLTRNGLVTLYVAAPGAAEMTGEEQPAPAPANVAPAAPDAGEEDAPSAAAPRRRRKSRRAASTGKVFETPPTPAPPSEAPPHESEQAEGWDHDGAGESVWLDQAAVGEEPGDELAGDELTDEFVVHVDDLFAGRGRPLWRRVYPRRGVRVRLAGHPWLFGITGAMLAVWVVVGVAAALAGHPRSAHRTSAARTIVKQDGAARPAGAVKPSPSRPPAAAHRGIGASRRHRRRTAPVAAAPSVSRAPARSVPVTPQASAPVAPASPRPEPAPATAPPASAPAPAPEQTGGGPFSP